MVFFRFIICASIALSSGCTELPVAKFGVVHGNDVIPTTRIHHRPGARFGYQLDFSRDSGVIKIRDEFFQPGRARWRLDPSSKENMTRHMVRRESADGRLRTREFELEGYEAGGWFRTSWKIEPSDPKGAHRIRIWLNGRPPKEFNFRVE